MGMTTRTRFYGRSEGVLGRMGALMTMVPRYMTVICGTCGSRVRVAQHAEPTLEGHLIVRPLYAHTCPGPRRYEMPAGSPTEG